MIERKLLFVGEERSERAKQLGVRWADGRLAAKQLFDALRACCLDPELCHYTNWFERGGKKRTREHSGIVVGLGQRVQAALRDSKIVHVALIHPAARGKIRKKSRYFQHVREVFRKQGILT